MDYIPIPVAIFESPNYRRVSHADRDMLLNLYRKFGAAETFQLSDEDLREFGYYQSNAHFPRVKSLRENGFIQVVELGVRGEHGRRTEYRLTYRVTAC